MKPLMVPYPALTGYPLSTAIVVAAMWELYAQQVPPKQPKLVFAAHPFLERLGKPYDDATLRELEEVLHAIYRLQKIGYTRNYVDGVDTITIWLTPDIVKRVVAYQESLEETT